MSGNSHTCHLGNKPDCSTSLTTGFRGHFLTFVTATKMKNVDVAAPGELNEVGGTSYGNLG